MASSNYRILGRRLRKQAGCFFALRFLVDERHPASSTFVFFTQVLLGVPARAGEGACSTEHLSTVHVSTERTPTERTRPNVPKVVCGNVELCGLEVESHDRPVGFGVSVRPNVPDRTYPTERTRPNVPKVVCGNVELCGLEVESHDRPVGFGVSVHFVESDAWSMLVADGCPRCPGHSGRSVRDIGQR